MGIFKRYKPEERFTRIPNQTLQDTELTWQARGMLAYLLSLPPTWNVSIKHLAGQAPNGESSVRTILQQLEGRGYFYRVREQRKDGTFEWVRIVFASLDERAEFDLENNGKSTSGKSTSGDSTRGATTSGKSTSGKPRSIETIDIKTKQEETKQQETKEGETARAQKSEVGLDFDPDWPEPEDFPVVQKSSESDPENKNVPARVEVIDNKYDRAFVSGRRDRKQYYQDKADEETVNSRVWTVAERDEFWRLTTVRLISENPGLPEGKARAIASGFCNQLNSERVTNPQATELYQAFLAGTLCARAKPANARDIKLDSAFERLRRKYA